MRNKVRAYIDVTLTMQLIEKEDTEKALSVARKGELTPIQRVWVLTQAAKIVAKTEREKALEIIDEAANEARRIDVSDADRPRALIAVANALLKADPPRAWESMPEISKAANSAEGLPAKRRAGGRCNPIKHRGTSTLMTSILRSFRPSPAAYRKAWRWRAVRTEAPRAAAVIP